MGEGSARQAVGVLVTAFRQENVSEATVELYVAKLADIPERLLAATVSKLIDTARFFPSIAELRHMAAALAGVLPPTPEEAVAIVRKADVREPVLRRDGSFAYEERFWVFPPDLPEGTRRAIKRVLEKLGDPVVRDQAVFGWENDFRKCYEEVAEAVRQEALADLSRAALPAPSRKALTEGVQVRLPAPRPGEYPCGYMPGFDSRHRPDCGVCAAATVSGPPATPQPEELPEPVNLAESLARVREVVESLSAKKAMPSGVGE